MSKNNAALALPPGDRDDAAVLPKETEASDLFAGRDEVAPVQPGGADQETPQERKEELLPGLTLELDRIGQILDETQMALGDLKLARSQNNWPTLEAAATRLATLAQHAARTVLQARITHQQSTHTKE